MKFIHHIYKNLSVLAILLMLALGCVYGFAPAQLGTPVLSAGSDDTLSRYGVAKTVVATPQELHETHPIDLHNPSNLKQEIEYDYVNDRYVVHTKIGDQKLDYGIPMTKSEYMDYSERAVRAAYFRDMNRKAYEEAESNGQTGDFDLLDMQFSLGPAEKLFGKGGLRVKTQGSASISLGMKHNQIDNPTLTERARDQWTLDFDQNIQLNMNAKVGTKMSFDLNYNTKATFDFDANKFKLAFSGDEDNIVQNLEAGNVSMTTGNSLISGGAALFGIKAGLKFGKLNVTALLAKQESTSKTVASKGGVTSKIFEIQATAYDENRHFFLSQYFRDHYDAWMSKLPLVSSGIEITKIEVWVTNKKSSYDEARNILAWMDLGEAGGHIHNRHWTSNSTTGYPESKANSLYSEITESYAGIRDISNVASVLAPLEANYGVTGGTDYEKIESARLLNRSEYVLNSSLGYISLKSKLDDDMVLAVAFQYTKGGKTYQVGEFSTDNSSSTNQTLMVKLLKSTAGNPAVPTWDLMMKNVYAIGASQLKKESFTLQVQYMSDTLGVYTNYINESPIADQLLIKVMNLDRLNANQESFPNGQFDWVEGYTVNSSTGRIYFPVVEPFGTWLASKLGNETLARRYCFYELYDSTLTVAEQIAEKNKFRLKGEYSASNGAEIDLGAMNVARGSVRVTAGGVTLVENTDYTVDYTMGVVTILNESILESGTSVSVSLEDQSTFSLQRKTMMGLDLQYDYSEDLKFGATVMNLSEKPLTTKVSMSDIPINNTIYGFNFKWNKDFMWLTNVIGSIPWVNVTKPSNISIQAEYAQLIAGHSSEISSAGNVYIDDFESSESSTDISSPSQWQLSSTPYDDGASPLFPEASRTNDIDYGSHRALFSWYNVERMFTSQSSSLTPSHIKHDLDQLSDHRVRQVNYDEIYPNKELTYGETGILNVLNLAFYPRERGPYNVSTTEMGEDGYLKHPSRSWGGMMRSFDVTNFENANYEYIEFWLMDPFVNDSTGTNEGGDLYFNLGEISEDILKDGLKSFENGLDINGDTTYTTTSVWGRVSRRTSTVYAFDNSSSSHAAQDVGLNGLSTAQEKQFHTYRNYVETLQAQVSPETLARWEADPFSPLNDPAGDNFHFYRGSDWDDAKTSILNRYKYFRGTEGNSPSTSDSGESYSTAAKSTPDVEDINSDNTLNEYERYYEYHVSLRPADMYVGHNYIEAVNEASVTLRNGQKTKVRWYQFKIPIRNYEKKIGAISNFKSIRFMRMYMTGWEQEQVLRMATLELVRSDWRNYTASSLADAGYSVAGNGTLASSTVNIEENAGSYPVNYVLPPGIDRVVDPGQSTSTLLNEQAMQLSVLDLEPHDALAVYKNSGLDMRQYERVQLFIHGEALPDNITQLASGDLSVFVRLGSDYKDNYYEYEVPLQITPAGSYNNNSDQDRLAVWPEANMIDLDLSKLTTLKKERNREKQHELSGVKFTTHYSKYDKDRPQNKMTIIGNPSLSEVGVIMVGIRNNGRTSKSGKIWVNELRLRGIRENGGWAARGQATLQMSDIATLAASGSYSSAGFGSIEQSTAERKLTNDWQYAFSAQTDLGRWVPESWKLSAPIYYSQSKSVSSPKFDPYNEDLTLDETLDTYDSDRQKDSIRSLVQTVSEDYNFALSGVKFNIKSKKAKPWDPANFQASYSLNKRYAHDPTTEYEDNRNWKFTFNYNYAPYFTPWKPFEQKSSSNASRNTDKKNSKAAKGANQASSKNGKKSSILSKYLNQFQIGWLPNNISLSMAINRTYHEEQLRNVDSYGEGYKIPVTYSKTFTWLRQSSISWDLTKTLKFNFNSATNARVDEPDVPVNRNLYPDEYERWRDTIMTQIWKLGTPVAYNQSFDATWNVPLNLISFLDWTNNSVKYKSSYAWNRGTQIDPNTFTGNSIQNSATLQWDGRFNLENLYNKSPFLKKANERFSGKKSKSNKSTNTKRRNDRSSQASRDLNDAADGKGLSRGAQSNAKSKNAFKGDLILSGREKQFKHNLKSKRLLVSIRDKETNRVVDLKWKRVDENTIRVINPDSTQSRAYIVSVSALKPLDETAWYKTLQVVARGLMMVRSVQVGYNYQQQTFLPSFVPEVGDAFGQHKTSGNPMAPGLGFAFGFEGGERFTEKAIDNGWLILSDSLTTPAVYSWTKNFTYSAVLEPFPGFKINLSGAHKHNERQSHQFMYSDLAITKSGSFQMTTIALGSAFGGLSSSDSYSSSAFSEFLANRKVIYDRFLHKYEGSRYPTTGFMTEHQQQAGTPYKGVLGESRLNSSDVLVPAFLAAYTGGDASSISLSAFPQWYKALPNWKLTYDGFTKLFPWFEKHFKTFSLSHAYTCTYNVGSYATYTNYAENDQGLGFTLDAGSDMPVPSSEFNISTVTLSESFAPLIGVNFTTNNNVSGNVQWKQTRAITLNMSSAQLVEVVSKDLTVGAGYKFENFGAKMGWTFSGDKKNQVSQDLNLKLDVTYKNQISVLRKIQDEYSQATSGNKAWTIRFTGDYQFSRMLKMQFYYDKQINTPLISSSYPTINTTFGLTLAFSLTR